jgi:hypothetical protein
VHTRSKLAKVNNRMRVQSHSIIGFLYSTGIRAPGIVGHTNISLYPFLVWKAFTFVNMSWHDISINYNE